MTTVDPASPDALCFAFSGGDLLVVDGEKEKVPTFGEVKRSGLDLRLVHGLAPLEGRECVAVNLDLDVKAPAGTYLRDFRALIGSSVDLEFFLRAGRARMISDWHRNNRFCGRCATETVKSAGELAMRCPRCGAVFFPKISPAAIILIRDGDRLLLARSPGFPPGVYSALAGFVEVGEGVEETIRREIREEVGVEVGEIEYFGSQTWPFPDSLMLGFTATYTGGEIRLQEDEIEDAGWFTVDTLPTLPPRLSIARSMLDAFIREMTVKKEL
ncbi:NAD(+) diphosphatase [Rubrobacter indicoceani]|uniref:NAD(+) diphosphatase n=1 Tax=Rubrobacter indicoceani TaxID=2051957 RepID=UPI000E5AF905|nr:NAD(+) diphosphatase [Rubrobacter indicoceani]